jgi:hypothetical protein
MSQTASEKFLYFTVGLLKGSPALEALRQDATKYHMIDLPGQLIALRLTEYYELIEKGIVQPGVQIPAVKVSPTPETTAGNEQTASTDASQRAAQISLSSPAAPLTNAQSQPMSMDQSHGRLPVYTETTTNGSESSTMALNQFTGQMRAFRRENDAIVTVSSAADQNADDAADYWSTL